MPYRRFEDGELVLRDVLALDRTVLANERTVLAYARTSIMLIVSAVSLLKVFPDSPTALVVGVALLPLSALVAGLGIRRYFRLRQSLMELLQRK